MAALRLLQKAPRNRGRDKHGPARPEAPHIPRASRAIGAALQFIEKMERGFGPSV